MEKWIALVVLVGIVILFRDVWALFLVRLVAFGVCLGAMAALYPALTSLLVQFGVQDAAVGRWLAAAVFLVLCIMALRWTTRRVRAGPLGDWQAVAMDAGRAGLVAAAATALLLAAGWATDQAGVTRASLAAWTIALAGIDACFPAGVGWISRRFGSV